MSRLHRSNGYSTRIKTHVSKRLLCDLRPSIHPKWNESNNPNHGPKLLRLKTGRNWRKTGRQTNNNTSHVLPPQGRASAPSDPTFQTPIFFWTWRGIQTRTSDHGRLLNSFRVIPIPASNGFPTGFRVRRGLFLTCRRTPKDSGSGIGIVVVLVIAVLVAEANPSPLVGSSGSAASSRHSHCQHWDPQGRPQARTTQRGVAWRPFASPWSVSQIEIFSVWRRRNE